MDSRLFYRLRNIDGRTPYVALAPMEDVSDGSFRRMCRRFGADIVYTEFASAEGLIRDAGRTMRKLEFGEMERPIGIQIFGANEYSMSEAAKRATDFGPDFIDINGGCPVKKVVRNGSGAALLRDISLFRRVIRAVVCATSLPVSVKMRVGWDQDHLIFSSAIDMFADEGVAWVALHGRTRAQGYKGKSNWQWIYQAARKRKLPVIGNGDICSVEDAALHVTECRELAGIMIGRWAIGSPWVFEAVRHYLNTGEKLSEPRLDQRIQYLKEHLDMAVDEHGERMGIISMRKHFHGYIKGCPGAAALRNALMKVCTRKDIGSLLDAYAERAHSSIALKCP